MQIQVTKDIEFNFIEANGIRIHTAQSGPVDGPLIVLLHGFPEYWRAWTKQIEPLAEAGFRVVVPDQRGYNLSDKPKGVKAYRIGTLAADVVGLIDALGREKAVLAGHDWGAVVAWQTAIQYPQRLEKLAILNVPHPAVMMRTLQKSLRQILKSWYIFYFQIPFLPEWIMSRGNYAPMRRMMKASSGSDTFSEADLDHYAQAWSQPGALTAMLNWYRAMFRQAMRSLSRDEKQGSARRVQIPTLMLWGVKDIALSRQMAQPSIELCDQGRLIFFENATHWVQHDEPDGVTQILVSFFSH